MDITLAHGTANDFVVIADLADRIEVSAALVRALCDRRRGVGADGVLRLGDGRGEADVFMDHRNADGSLAEMCGNGVRVVAKHVVDHGLVTVGDEETLRIGTRAGVKTVRIAARDADGSVASVAVDMGVPRTAAADVPFETDTPGALTHRVELGAATVELSVVSMGNPHGVLVVDDVAAADVVTLGPALETHERFPAKANIGFAQVVHRGEVRLRVWERGVGETAACGTGACAAVVALQGLGYLDADVLVRLPGGVLRIEHALEGMEAVRMTGPAVEVLHGHLEDAWLAAASRGDLEA